MNHLQEYDKLKKNYPNISLLWKSVFLNDNNESSDLISQSKNIIHRLKMDKNARDLSKLEIIAIYCLLQCDQ